MKLKTSIPSNDVKLIDLYNKIISGSLETGPYFQRKLVWKKQHKYAFIETILMNFPFPEIYIASKEVDVTTLQAKEEVVDGQQRLNSIVDYIKGQNDFKNQNKVTPFDDLTIEQKKDFLNYSITVKDLKDIGEENIREVFKRINSTNYSLNRNEILNAEYYESEFAILSKILIEENFQPNDKITDINIDPVIKEKIQSFFKQNNIFSDNDIKRMFNSQYLMLVIATYLEGSYFNRSSRVEYYLEKYNREFDNYEEMISLLINAIDIIDQLNFPKESYWFNKANLFTLLVELRGIDKKQLDFPTLETSLLDLENKFDIFYNSEDEEAIKKFTQDETRYFENARHGSHEVTAREHRGKVIRALINNALINKELPTMQDINQEEKNMEEKNLTYFFEKQIKYSYQSITETVLNKSILDAISNIRSFLKENNIHDYPNQQLGKEHKKELEGFFLTPDKQPESTMLSLYRSNGRGDYRLSITNLKEFIDPNNKIVFLLINGKLAILNVTKYDYTTMDFNNINL